MTRLAPKLETAKLPGHLVWLRRASSQQAVAADSERTVRALKNGPLPLRGCDSMTQLLDALDAQTAMLILPARSLVEGADVLLRERLLAMVDRTDLPVVVVTADTSFTPLTSEIDLLSDACSLMVLPEGVLAGSLPGLMKMAVQSHRLHDQPIAQMSTAGGSLVDHDQLLQSLLKTLPVGIAIAHEVECRDVTMNEACGQILGIAHHLNPSQSGPDQSLLDFTFFDNGKPVATPDLPMQYTARTGKGVRDQELQIVRGDGTKLNIVVSTVPLHDHKGQLNGCAGVLVDITTQKKTQLALAKSEARLNLAQKCAKAGVWEWNLITGELIWSSALCQLFGLPENFESSMHAWHDVIHPEDLEDYIAAIGNQMEFQIEHRIRRADGQEQWVLTSGQPTYDQQGRPERMLGNCVDITSRKKAAQSLRETAVRFRTMMDGSPLGVFITDDQGRYQYTNAVLQRISHMTDAQLVSQGLLNTVHPDEKQDVLNAWHHSLANQIRFEQICRLQLPDDQQPWIHIRAMPVIDDQKFSGYIGKVEDITRQRRAQAALRLSQERLLKANNTLAQRNEDMEEMLSITAHDLKHPVVGIQGLLSLLNEDVYDKLDKENQLNLDLSLGECERMKEMLTRLSELGRIEQTRPRMGMASLLEVVETCVRRYQAVCMKRQITINVDVPQTQIRMPQAILEEVLSNLIDNAIKYGCTAEPAIIEITASCQDETCAISVKDNGQGIDEQHHERIFRPFRRLAGKQDTGGSGLGLTAVKRLIQRIGGQVRLTSIPNQGACFEMKFPIKEDKPCEDPSD